MHLLPYPPIIRFIYAIYLLLLSSLQFRPDIKISRCFIHSDMLEIKTLLCLCRLVPRIHPEESKCQGETIFLGGVYLGCLIVICALT